MSEIPVSNKVDDKAQHPFKTVCKMILAVTMIVLISLVILTTIAGVMGIIVWLWMRTVFPDETLAPNWTNWASWAIWIMLCLVTWAELYSWRMSLTFREWIHAARGYGRRSITG